MSKLKGDEAADRFDAWANGQPLSYFREIANRNRTQLVRTFIMEAVGIDRPALRQNTRIQRTLADLEERLRVEGVLAGLPVKTATEMGEELPLPFRASTSAPNNRDAERLSRLEKEIAAKDAELVELRPLRFENQRLKQLVRELRDQLRRFGAMDEVLRESGRLPR